MNNFQRTTRQLALATAFLALTGPITTASVKSADDGYLTIFRNLTLADAADATEIFSENYGIPLKVGDNGSSLRAPKAQARRAQATLVRLMQTQQFPKFSGCSLIFPQPTEAEMASRRQQSTVELPSDAD